jgi:succinate dehydrogenase/fumarate reductase flavoprotein subunit
VASDVVVVGAGMGGLVAAIAAQEEGAHVTLLEKASEPGGSLAISGGYVWTLPAVELYDQIVPHGDRNLGRILVEDFTTGLEWLEAHRVRLGPPQDGLGPERMGRGRRIDPDSVSGAVRPLLEAFQEAGGEVRCRTAALKVDQDLDGSVSGVVCRSNGKTSTLRAVSVVIATGGFQGDMEMMTRHVSPWAEYALLRSSPTCVGDGIRMALTAGASVSKGMNSVYGHVMAAEPIEMDPAAFRAMTQFYVENCILLNLAGVRFVDESRADAVCGIALLQQPQARGFIVFDEVRHSTKVMDPFVPDAERTDPVQLIRSSGGTVHQANTLAGLCAQLEPYGVPRKVAQQTIEDFDVAGRRGDASALPVQRQRDIHVCSTPPFYAVPVRAGVTFTEGGVRVNAQCAALDRDGRAVRGLYVAGVDVGAVSNVGYAGGLSAALITGLRAGIHAARAS